ncbi:MAG: metal ABC transporter permease [Eubacteriales bacterium]|nr:metal ABC transporter permease [Eubacteriales bacterium]
MGPILEMFQYDFMQKAFLMSVVLSMAIPCIGVIVVFKRLSMTGDALSHSSLAGVATGIVFSLNPIFTSMAACLLAALVIELIRRRIPHHADLAIAVVMSANVAVAGVMTRFMKRATNLHSFLFGSIVAVTTEEMISVLVISALVIIVFFLFYKELFYTTYDEESARLAGVPVNVVNIIFTFLTALTISVAARTVGTLIVSSFIVVPIACAMQFAGSFKGTIRQAVGYAVFFSMVGLTLSYHFKLVPGATMVLVGIITLAIVVVAKRMLHALRRII